MDSFECTVGYLCLIHNTLIILLLRLWKGGWLVLNVLLALYLSLVHQRGVVDVAVWLGQQGIFEYTFE